MTIQLSGRTSAGGRLLRLSRFVLLAVGLLARSAFAPAAAAQAAGPADWRRVASVADVWRTYPDRVRTLLGALDLRRPELDAVRTAAAEGDTVAAAAALLEHYRGGAAGGWLLQARAERASPASGSGDRLREADQALRDTVTFQEVTDRIPRGAAGQLRWDHLGPHQDREFGYFLNRHGPLVALLEAWRATGRPDYAAGYDRLVRDWVVHNPAPDERRKPAAIQWRTLEAGLRLAGVWPLTFFGFQAAEEFTPAARLLLLSSLPEHAEYLFHHHKKDHNWAVMEMNGLALTALVFPEFARAEAWYRRALEQMQAEMRRTVYPDGVLHETTTHYHIVALRNFQQFASNSRRAGRPVPEEFARTLEAMYRYVALSVRPDGHIPMDNDGDRFDARPILRAAAREYGQPDWEYGVSNGKRGTRPEGVPSVVFPWAGRVVMRSGWGADAHWGFFDVGPWGSTHQHDDKLHLSVAAHGRDLLVDGGRYHYSSTPFRRFFVSSAAHNVVLVDGRGQSREAGRAEMIASAPLDPGSYRLTSELDYARGSYRGGFDGVEGRAEHTRAVLYVRDRFWVVVDRVETDRPRRLETLWHFHPDCTVAVDAGSVATVDAGRGNLRVVPAGDLSWRVEVVRGRTEPQIQGWYSERYNHKEPSPVAVYSAPVDGDAVFAWVLVPALGPVPEVRARLLSTAGGSARVRVEEAGKPPVEVVVPLRPGAAAPGVARAPE